MYFLFGYWIIEKMRKKLGSIKYYKNLADTLFSKRVRARGACQGPICGGSTETLQCAHVVGRGNFNLRWEEPNALCLCNKCHRWQEKYPNQFKVWFKNNFPDEYAYIKSREQIIIRRTREDYKQLCEWLKEKL